MQKSALESGLGGSVKGSLRFKYTVDSALLGALTRPFRKFIQRRQEQFMGYIMGNMAKGGEFAESSFDDFLGPIEREGDSIAIRQFHETFKK